MTMKTEKVRAGRVLPSLKDTAPAEAPAKANGESVTTVQPKADPAREVQLKAATGLVRRERNGIKEPSAGGLCWKAWQACDATMADLKRTPTPAEVNASKHAAGLNATNVKVEYSYWRRFHGYPRAVLPPIADSTKTAEGKEA